MDILTSSLPVTTATLSIEEGSLVALKKEKKTYHPGSVIIQPWIASDYHHIITQTTSNDIQVIKGGKKCVFLGIKVHIETQEESAGINTWVAEDALDIIPKPLRVSKK